MRSGRPFYAMPELCDGYRRDLKLVSWSGCYPVLEVKTTPLASNDDVSVENYRHLSAGVLRTLRAASRSRYHAFASFSGKSTLARTSANSRPTQTLSLSGTRRAYGSPFFKSTNVTF